MSVFSVVENKTLITSHNPADCKIVGRKSNLTTQPLSAVFWFLIHQFTFKGILLL